MPQAVLNPEEIGDFTTGKRVSAQLPRHVRELGFIPDFDLWKPGDLLLFSATHPNFAQRQIKQAQERLGYGDEDAKWHHAAVYVGDGYMCEARPGGVRYHPVVDNVRDYLIRARRDEELTLEEAFRVAIRALMRLNIYYSYTSLVAAFLRSWTLDDHRVLSPHYRATRSAVICSQLFHDSYMEVTYRTLVENHKQEMVPAGLSACSGLSDIDSSWTKLPDPS